MFQWTLKNDIYLLKYGCTIDRDKKDKDVRVSLFHLIQKTFALMNRLAIYKPNHLLVS